jgi:leucyl/phenylalanyl-tRNA--protein transferase
MSDARDSTDINWIEPHERGVIMLDEFHVPKRLARFMKSSPYTIHFNRDFAGVMAACANRETTWINADIERVYNELHTLGHAHSVESYNENDELVGGLYGIAMGRVFFGESMFSTQTNASKVALVALVDYLKAHDFALLDTQFITDHLRQFGAKAIPQSDYVRLLGDLLTA